MTRTILITNGYRNVPREDYKGKFAFLAEADFSGEKGFERLKKAWAKTTERITEDKYVDAAGGIFRMPFVEQVEQIVKRDQVWCLSNGVGAVRLDSKHPQYDLGEGDKDIRRICDTARPTEWWHFLREQGGIDFEKTMINAVEHGIRMIFALPRSSYEMIRDELMNVAKWAGEDESGGRLEKARIYMRFVGKTPELLIPSKLLACVMPYDEEAIDRLVPGNTSNRHRRAAFLFKKLFPLEESGADPREPLKDAAKLQKVYDSGEEAMFHYKAREKAAGRKKMSPEEMRKLIKAAAKEVGDNAMRVTRYLKDEGHKVRVDKVQAIMDGGEGDEARAPRAAKKAVAAKPGRKAGGASKRSGPKGRAGRQPSLT